LKIEVLRLMAEGCKYEEIDERLFVSVNTVRHHIRNVYGKLDGNNRTQAVGKAKELNILQFPLNLFPKNRIFSPHQPHEYAVIFYPITAILGR